MLDGFLEQMGILEELGKRRGWISRSAGYFGGVMLNVRSVG